MYPSLQIHRYQHELAVYQDRWLRETELQRTEQQYSHAGLLGEFAGAVKRLDFPAQHLGPLEPYHQLALGDARFYAGDTSFAGEFRAADVTDAFDSAFITCFDTSSNGMK